MFYIHCPRSAFVHSFIHFQFVLLLLLLLLSAPLLLLVCECFFLSSKRRTQYTPFRFGSFISLSESKYIGTAPSSPSSSFWCSCRERLDCAHDNCEIAVDGRRAREKSIQSFRCTLTLCISHNNPKTYIQPGQMYTKTIYKSYNTCMDCAIQN